MHTETENDPNDSNLKSKKKKLTSSLPSNNSSSTDYKESVFLISKSETFLVKNINPEVCLRRDIGVLRCKDRNNQLKPARILTFILIINEEWIIAHPRVP